jgi:putative redox protein
MIADKSKELKTTIQLVNEKLHFKGEVAGNQSISIDYTPPLGDNLGYTSLELFLLSLSSCAGSAILVVLRKMNKSISSLEIASVGVRKQEHPTGFKSITLNINLKSADVTSSDMERALQLMESICPVLSMLDGGIEKKFNYKLNE